MPINKGQKGSKETQNATEANYAAWMHALLEDFAGEIPKLAYALHLILKTKEDRNPTDIKRLTNTIRHWYGDRRSAPAIDDELTSSALIQLVNERKISQPKAAGTASFEDALLELQVFRSNSKIAGKAGETDASKLFEQNILTYPVVGIKNFSLESIDQHSALFENQVPDYLHRDIDDELVGRFDNNFVPYVIISGNPKSGKTRTALELLKQSKLKSRDLYWLSPLPGSAQMFIDSVPVSNKAKSVIFIDDLQNFDFDPVSGLTIARFKELAARGKVVATIHSTSLSSFLNRSKQRTEASSHRGQNFDRFSTEKERENSNSVFEIEESIISLESNLSQREYDNMSPLLREKLGLQEFDNEFPFAATLASVDQLAVKATDVLKREDISTAVLRAAIDCYLAFYGGATDEFILELSKRHYGRIQQNSRWRQEKALDAFDELTEGVVAGSEKAILLLDRSNQEKYEILDGLWEHIRPDKTKWSPDLLLDMIDEGAANDLASISFDLGYTTQAKYILRKLIQANYEPALLNLADLLLSEGSTEESKENYKFAAESGNLYAQNRLGLIIEDEGDIDQANDWYQKAAEAGFDWAQYNLADNLEDAGEIELAMKWYTNAANQGLAEAQNRLGVIASKSGDDELANSWYLKAAESGFDWAQFNLANNLRDSGDEKTAVGWYTKAAEQGLVNAQTVLGLIAEEVDGDLELANSWYLKAAEAGFHWAQHNLADNFQRAGDIQSAIDWYTKAAEQGLPQSQTRLGLIAEEDQGDIASANSWYLKAAEAGFDWAQYNLADNLQDAGDIQGAIDWFTKAADQGLAKAQNRLGLIAEEIQGDKELARTWYLKAAEADLPGAQYNLADILEDSGDIQKAIDWYKRAAEHSMPEAQNRLGLIAAEHQNDADVAREWYQKAADAGLDSAQYNLAVILEDSGEIEKAIDWYSKAAEQGLLNAQNWLGVLLERSGKVELAISCYLRAAEAGHDWAQYNLADTFQKLGENQNAIYWYKKASENGIAEAKERLAGMESTTVPTVGEGSKRRKVKADTGPERVASSKLTSLEAVQEPQSQNQPKPKKRSKLK
jgi:TPR repeat protein